MKRIVILLLSMIPLTLLGFELLISGGYTFVEKRGWNVKFGFLQTPFEADIGVSFDFESSPTKMCFDVSVLFPMFDFSFFRAGAALVYTRDNYTGDWTEFSGAGVLLQSKAEDFDLRLGFLYPFTEEGIEPTRDVLFELRYYLKPPEGRHFKDRLFVELVYHAGFFRFGIGLIEPLP